MVLSENQVGSLKSVLDAKALEDSRSDLDFDLDLYLNDEEDNDDNVVVPQTPNEEVKDRQEKDKIGSKPDKNGKPWDRVFKIKDALGTKQYKPEDIQELFRQLLNDVQNIHEELAEYINTPGWNRPAFYDNDDDDDDVDYTIAITPVLSIEEPIDSLS
nr:hypothetical protein [Tanacetum cinerariifolium]